MASVIKLPNIINHEPIKTEPIKTEPNNISCDNKLPNIIKTSTSNIKHASQVSINNNNRDNLYSHGNTSIALHESNLTNENDNKVSIKDTSVVPGTMEPKHSTSAIHGLLPKHQQDSGISLTSSDLNQQDNNMDDKQYLQDNYDEWFLPDQYADYKAEKMKNLTKSLIEMTKDTESAKSSNSFVIDASDTTPEEDDYLKSAQTELGSKETKKKKEAKNEDEPTSNLDEVENRVARLMEYLNKHVPDEDTESIAHQDDTESIAHQDDTESIAHQEDTESKSTKSLVNNNSNGNSSQNIERTQSRSSQEILNHSDVKDQSKQSLLLQTNNTKLASSSKVQNQSSVKSDIKVFSNAAKVSTKKPSEGLISIEKSPVVRRRPARSHSPRITQTRSVQQRQIKTENTEQKKQSVKKKVKERNYFKPIQAPAIPPVRHAKTHLPKTFTAPNTAKSPPTKPKRYSPKLSRRYKRPIVHEPPTTIRYPSRSERERQLKEAEELMSTRSTSSPRSHSTDDQTTIFDDVFSQGGEQNDTTSDDHPFHKFQSNNTALPTTSDDTTQSVVSSASVVPSTSKGPNNSDNPTGNHSHTSEDHSQPVNPSESDKLVTLKDPETSKDPGQSQVEASPEELKTMDTLLKISEKCFVRKSKPHVSRSS